MMNKRGAAEMSAESLIWLWRLIPVSIVIIFFFVIAIVYLSAEFDTETMQQDLIRETALNCLSTFPGQIEKEKITTEQLQQCYQDPKWGYQVTLKDFTKEKVVAQAAVLTRQQETDFELCSTKPEVVCSTEEIYTLFNEQQQGWLIFAFITHE